MLKHRQYVYFYIVLRATLNDTFTAKYYGVLLRTPSVKPKSSFTPFLHITCRKPSIKITIKNEIKYLILMCLMKSPFTLKNNHCKIDNLVLKNNNFSNGHGSTCTLKREII